MAGPAGGGRGGRGQSANDRGSVAVETGEELTVTERILPHAKAVVLAIEPLETIDPTRPIGRVIT